MTAASQLYASLWGEIEDWDPGAEMLDAMGINPEDFTVAQQDIADLLQDYGDIELEEHEEALEGEEY